MADRAVLARWDGDTDGAAHHLRAALDLATALGLPLEIRSAQAALNQL